MNKKSQLIALASISISMAALSANADTIIPASTTSPDINNPVSNTGIGPVIQNYGAVTNIINGIFSANITTGTDSGAAILNAQDIGLIKHTLFVLNQSQNGGALYNEGDIYTIDNSIFHGNAALKFGGAIYNKDNIHKIAKSKFINNFSQNAGGAIYNSEHIGEIVDSDFYANASNREGGAINTRVNLAISAKEQNVVFTGNTDVSGSNAIHIENGPVHLNAFNGRSITINDGINGNSLKNKTSLNINDGIDGFNRVIQDVDADNFGMVYLNNNIKNQRIFVKGGTLNLDSYKNGGTDYDRDGNLVSNSVASLINTDITVSTNATLQINELGIDANSSISGDGKVVMSDDVKLNFNLDTLTESDEEQLFAFLVNEEAESILAGLEESNLAAFYKGQELEFVDSSNPLENGQFTVKRDSNALNLVAQIPEPATLSLLGLTSGAVLFIRRRIFK